MSFVVSQTVSLTFSVNINCCSSSSTSANSSSPNSMPTHKLWAVVVILSIAVNKKNNQNVKINVVLFFCHVSYHTIKTFLKKFYEKNITLKK